MANEFLDLLTITIEGDQVAGRHKYTGDLEKRDRNGLPYEPLCLDTGRLDVQVLDLCRRLIQEGRICSKPDFLLIGQLLHKAIFTRKIKDLFNSLRTIGRPNSKNRLRVELEFRGKDELGLFKLPWEYLCYQSNHDDQNVQWDFVSTVAELVLTRYLEPGGGGKVVELDQKKIDVLLVVSNPDPSQEGLGDLTSVEKGVKADLNAFKQKLSANNIEVNICEMPKPVTWKNFSKFINDCRPHILHLISHGKFEEASKSRAGKIAFHLLDDPENWDILPEGGNIEWKLDREFVNLFTQAQNLPRLAFLHMCEGGAIDKQDTTAGVALHLAQSGVPAVVAMQHPIEKDTSSMFSHAFYASLGEGRTIEEAVQLGRAKIALQDANSGAFATPVLYLSTRHDPVLPIAQPDTSRIIDSITHHKEIVPIYVEYLDEKKLTLDQIQPLTVRLQPLIGKGIEAWLSELENYYKSLSDVYSGQKNLGNLCVALKLRLKELGKTA